MNLPASPASSTEKFFLVQGEHPTVPGRRMSLHKTKAGADKAAAELVKIIADDCDVTETVTEENWRAVLDKIIAGLDTEAAELVDVWITDLNVEE